MEILDVETMDDIRVMSLLVHGTSEPEESLTLEEWKKFAEYFSMMPARRKEILIQKIKDGEIY